MSNSNASADVATYSNAGYAKRKWSLGILSVALIIIGLDVTVLNVAIPTLQAELQATAAGLQWIKCIHIGIRGCSPDDGSAW